jgi:hypothetical protein
VEIVDTFGFLVGRWRVTRSIEDHWNQSSGWFEGVATFAQGDSAAPERERSAHYDESGQLYFGDHTSAVQRHLDYRERVDGSVGLYFADGREFVDLNLGVGVWNSFHLCGNDKYSVATVARSQDIVEEHWQVRGPTKGYDAQTTLTREG